MLKTLTKPPIDAITGINNFVYLLLKAVYKE